MLATRALHVSGIGARCATYGCLAAAYPLGTSHITDQLDPAHAGPGRHWLTDDQEHERVFAYLVTGTAYQLTLHDEDTHYVLVAYPPGAAP
ncbi:hypothetical protein [Streptomyces sp. NPDC006193]|uniref:hypothetical protein n=1 Tax=Streptomyces sp. NPDC006193 TaxID=3155717 RepID=UPI0033B599EC